MSKKRKAMRAIKKDGGESIPLIPQGPIDKPIVCPQCQASNCKGCVQNNGVTRCGCTDPIHRQDPHVTDRPLPGYTPPYAVGTKAITPAPMKKKFHSHHWASKWVPPKPPSN